MCYHFIREFTIKSYNKNNKKVQKYKYNNKKNYNKNKKEKKSNHKS